MTAMSRRSYDQPTCGLAAALDLLGERWTLLIVRELLPGPKRYSDLATSLHGIGTNLLADRLRHLDEHGIIAKRTLPPPAASAVYELTDDGRDLEPIIVSLARWGQRFRMEPCGETLEPEQIMFELYAAFDAERAADIDALYRFVIDAHDIWVHVARGSVRAGSGMTRAPDADITADASTFLELLTGARDISSAVAGGSVSAEGRPDAIVASFDIFHR